MHKTVALNGHCTSVATKYDDIVFSVTPIRLWFNLEELSLSYPCNEMVKVYKMYKKVREKLV